MKLARKKALVAVAAVLLGLWNATATATGTPIELLSNLDRSIWAGKPLVAAPGQEADRQLNLMQKFTNANPDVFAGLDVDRRTRSVVMYYSATQAFTAWSLILNYQFSSWQHSWILVALPVLHSQRQLNDVMSRIASARVQPWTRNISPVLSGWYVDHGRNVVRVGVTRNDWLLALSTYAVFGDLVELYTLPRITRTRTLYRDQPDVDRAGTRRFDGYPQPPFNGGQILAQNFLLGMVECTAGFAVWDFQAKVAGLSTAGHCFVQTTFGNTVFSPGGGNIGNVALRSWDGDVILSPSETPPMRTTAMDVEVIRGRQVDPSIMFGPVTTFWSLPTIFLEHSLNKKDVVCSSGAVTGEVCDLEVITTQGCFVDDNMVTQCNLALAKRIGGGVAGQEGDSGAPVYKRATYEEIWKITYDNAGKVLTEETRTEDGVVPLGWAVGVATSDPTIMAFEKSTDLLSGTWEVACLKTMKPHQISVDLVGCDSGRMIKADIDHYAPLE